MTENGMITTNELISVIKEIKNCSIEYSDERFEVYRCNEGLIN